MTTQGHVPVKFEEGSSQGWARVGRLVAGWLLIVLGIIGVILPILPGIPLIFAGLTFIASEYAWARKALDWLISKLEVSRSWWSRRKLEHGKNAQAVKAPV